MKLYSTLVPIVLALGLAACEPAPPVSVNARDWSPKSPATAPVVRKNLVLVFDGSSSMLGQKLVEAKRAVGWYLGSLDASAKVALVSFDGHGARTVAALGAEPDELLVAVGSIQAGGLTPLGRSVGLAYEILAARARETDAIEQYHLAIVTDGAASDGDLLAANVGAILATPVQVCTIGFGLDGSHALNRPGTRYIPAADEAALKRGLGQILAEREDL